MTEDLEVFDETPPRRLAIGDLSPGQAVRQDLRFGAERLAAYEALSHDRAPVHHDPRFARSAGFERPIVPGLALSAGFSRLIGMYLPGERAILETIDLKFRRPVYPDRDLTFRAAVERVFPPMGVVELALSISADGAQHVSGVCRCLVR